MANEPVLDNVDRLQRSSRDVTTLPAVLSKWLSTVLPFFTWTQHLVLNRAVDLVPGADTATSHAAVSNPNGAVVGGEPWLFLVGGAYHDRLVRTPEGWRISHRVEETLWWDNPMPGLPPVPFPVPEDAFT